MSQTLADIIKSATEELKEAFQRGGRRGAEDEIGEIADGAVPVYNADLIAVFASNSSLGYVEPECGYGSAGDNIIGKMQAVIYEEVSDALYSALREIEEELEDEEAERLEALVNDLLEKGTRVVHVHTNQTGIIVSVDTSDPEGLPYSVLLDGMEEEEWFGPNDVEAPKSGD